MMTKMLGQYVQLPVDEEQEHMADDQFDPFPYPDYEAGDTKPDFMSNIAL